MISVLIDYKLEKYSREIRYTFDFIFDTLGLSHRFITKSEHLRQHDILLLYGLIGPTIEELQKITSSYITIYIQSDPKLYEPGGYTPDQLRRAIREVKLFTPTPVIASHKFDFPAENYTEIEIHGCKVNFDLAGNIFYHLAVMEEQCDNARNSRNCFPDSSSAFYHWRETPFIDNFLWLLDNLIKEQTRALDRYIIQKHYWPKAQDMASALTHTTDNLQKWDFNLILLSVLDDLAMFLTLRWKLLFRNLWSKFKYIFTNYEMYWNFQEFETLEKEHRMHSTWFIAAEQTSEIDYTLEDTDLQDEIKLILKQGGEVGLLCTDDKLSRDEFAQRKQIMLRQTQKEQIGIRQHDYCLNESIRDLHQKICPSFDSSLGLTESAGFRHGILFPYQPWVSSLRCSSLELPVCFRDRFLRLSKYSILGLEDAKKLIKKLFQSVRRRRGLFILDFTIAAWTDFPYCSKLYSYLLALIKAENSFNATLGEIADWWAKRSRVTIEESEFDFSIKFPEKLDNFALQYYGPHSILQIEGMDARLDGKTIYFTNIEPDSVAIVRLSNSSPTIQ